MRRVLMMAVFAGAGWAQTRPASPPAAPLSPAQSGGAASPTTTQPSSASQNVPATAPVATAAQTQKAPATPPASATPAAPAAPATPATPAAAATPQAAIAPSQAAMAASLEQQRASVLKQVNAISGKAPSSSASFFTVPWMDAAPQSPAMGASFNAPPCDPLPNDLLDPLIEQNAERENVQAALIRAVIGEESGSRPCAVSSKGAQGLMQLMPATIEQFGVTDPFDPKQNVDAGSKFLKQLLAKYNGDVRLALSAYNAG